MRLYQVLDTNLHSSTNSVGNRVRKSNVIFAGRLLKYSIDDETLLGKQELIRVYESSVMENGVFAVFVERVK